MAELSTVERPLDGAWFTGRFQMRCGRACAEIAWRVTDEFNQVFEGICWIQIAPLQHSLPETIPEKEVTRMCDLVLAGQEYEMSAEGRAAEAAVVQERIDADVVHKVKVLDGRAQKPLGVRPEVV